MRKRAGSLLRVAVVIVVPGVCGLALTDSAGAAGSIMATVTLVVRGLFGA